ncbi:MAG: hypothetical protein M0Q88_02935 [Bacilli bacterium]|nr:hypothetical protein [Bacilli bacterium]
MKKSNNDFTNEELFIIKAALTSRYNNLQDLVYGIDVTSKEVENIKLEQDEIENIVNKVNDLIVFGVTPMFTGNELKGVLLESFEPIE